MRFFLTLFVAGVTALAGTISTGGQVAGTTVNAIDITGFATTGDQMSGMIVTGNFDSSVGLVSLDCIWAAGAGTSGSCAASGSGAAFSLALTGDTFSATWSLGVTGSLNLRSLFFNGLPGFTVFDRDPALSTDGSANGADATGSTLGAANAAIDGTATYINQVGTMGNPPVGDIYSRVEIVFNGVGVAPIIGGPAATFTMDTDSIGLRGGDPGSGVPEPSTLAMIAGGLLLAGWRKRSAVR